MAIQEKGTLMKCASEYDEQVAFCKYLDFVHVTYFATNNENPMSYANRKVAMIQGAKAKAAGKKKGIPDMCLLIEGGKTVFIEMKRKTGGTVSKEQKQWLERLRVLGFDAYVCKGAKEAIEAVQKYLPESKKKVNSKQGSLL